MDIPVEIVLKAHVHRFVKSHFPHQDVIPIYRNSFPGFVLIPLLERNMSYHNNAYSKIEGKSMRFHISEFFFKRTGASISTNSIYCFNEQMDKIFREQLFKAVEVVLSINNSKGTAFEIKDTIMNFCAMHGIGEDDISYETLKKDFYRWRKMYGKRSKIFG